jgi:ligand-binding sensor domain-containing protein
MKNLQLLPIILLLIISACKKDDNTNNSTFSKSVNSIVVDKNNTKWVGAEDGLYKGVGSDLTIQDIAITGQILSLLYEEGTNTLWIGTDAGLFKAGLNGSEISGVTSVEPNNLSNPVIRNGYLDSNQKRWFGTDLGFTLNKEDKWKNDSFRINIQGRIFPMNPVELLGINSIASWDGDYFFATSGGNLFRGKEFVDSVDAFTGATQWASPYNGQNLTDTMLVVFVDSKGQQWMGGLNGIQVHTGHDEKDATSFTYYNSELAGNIIHAIAEAPDGKIWVGTEKGLSIFNGTNWTIQTQGLPDLYVTSIAFDKIDGSAWVGTKKGIVNIK